MLPFPTLKRRPLLNIWNIWEASTFKSTLVPFLLFSFPIGEHWEKSPPANIILYIVGPGGKRKTLIDICFVWFSFKAERLSWKRWEIKYIKSSASWKFFCQPKYANRDDRKQQSTKRSSLKNWKNWDLLRTGAGGGVFQSPNTYLNYVQLRISKRKVIIINSQS